jgi:hypothetical protein
MGCVEGGPPPPPAECVHPYRTERVCANWSAPGHTAHARPLQQLQQTGALLEPRESDGVAPLPRSMIPLSACTPPRKCLVHTGSPASGLARDVYLQGIIGLIAQAPAVTRLPSHGLPFSPRPRWRLVRTAPEPGDLARARSPPSFLPPRPLTIEAAPNCRWPPLHDVPTSC